jgi:hypothetical protein
MRVRRDLGAIAGIGVQHTLMGEAYEQMDEYEQAEREGRKALEVL